MQIHAIETETNIMPRKNPVNMSVYKYPYSWKTWGGFWGNIKSWFDIRRAAKQRAKLGYCYGDIWECGDTILDHTLAVLIEFRNKTNSWPCNEQFPEFENWLKYLDEIIELLDYARQDPDELSVYNKQYNTFVNKFRTDWTEEEHRIFEAYVAEVNEIALKQQEAQIKAFTMLAPNLKRIWW